MSSAFSYCQSKEFLGLFKVQMRGVEAIDEYLDFQQQVRNKIAARKHGIYLEKTSENLMAGCMSGGCIVDLSTYNGDKIIYLYIQCEPKLQNVQQRFSKILLLPDWLEDRFYLTFNGALADPRFAQLQPLKLISQLISYCMTAYGREDALFLSARANFAATQEYLDLRSRLIATGVSPNLGNDKNIFLFHRSYNHDRVLDNQVILKVKDNIALHELQNYLDMGYVGTAYHARTQTFTLQQRAAAVEAVLEGGITAA